MRPAPRWTTPLIAAFALFLPALTTAAEPLLLDGCHGTRSVRLNTGALAAGLPHWDPANRVLRDRLVLDGEDLSGVRPLHFGGDEAEVRFLHERSSSGAVLGRRLTAPSSQSYEILARGASHYAPSLDLGAGDACGQSAPMIYRPGLEAGGLSPVLEAPQIMQGDELENGNVRFRYDQLWPQSFVGSASGAVTIGTRYILAYPARILAVELVVANEGSGAAFEAQLFYDPEIVLDKPSPSQLLLSVPDVVPDAGELPMQVVRIPLFEGGIRLAPGTLWVGVRNLEGKSMHLAVGPSFDHAGNGFLSLGGEGWYDFGVQGPRDGRPMIRLLVAPEEETTSPLEAPTPRTAGGLR